MPVWRITAHHADPLAAVAWIRENERIAVGWGDVGDLDARNPSSPEELTEAVHAAYPGLRNAHLGGPSLWSLWTEVAPGDLAVISGGGRRHLVVEVLGPYQFRRRAMDDYFHQRWVRLTDLDPDAMWSQLGGVDQAALYRTVARCQGEALGDTAELGMSGDAGVYLEGVAVDLVATRFERDPRARAACLRAHGYSCQVCGLAFGERYGEIGVGFIHVHHLHSLAGNGPHLVDPERDMVPLCPNCHAMAHRRSPPYTVVELRAMWKP